MQEQGAVLTDLLLEAGLSLRASLWLLDPELSSWRLLLAMPEVDRKGPLHIYKTIRSTISKHSTQLSNLDIKRVAVVSPKHPLLQVLTSALHITKGSVRFSRNSINGHFIEDALIYRLV